MPVQDLRQAHLDHLTDEERHIVDPLCDDDQFTLPMSSAACGLSCILRVPSSITISPTRFEDNNLACLAKMPLYPALQNLLKIKFGSFSMANGDSY